MERKCNKCNGEQTATKLCLRCSKYFCEKVLTSKVVNEDTGKLDLENYCPECQGTDIIYLA